MKRKRKPARSRSYNELKFLFWAFLIAYVVFYFREILAKKFFLWEDLIEYLYPLRYYAVKALSEGHIPHWCPYIFSGMPFLAEPQTALFYPLNLLLVPLSKGGHLSYYLLELQLIFHFLIAAFSMYFIMRRWGASCLASITSGLVYAFSSFLVLHIIHGIIVNTFAWFPLVLYLYDRSLEKRSLTLSILTAFLLAFIALAGYPQLMVYMLLFMGLYLILYLIFGERRLSWGQRIKLFIYLGIITLVFAGLWLWQVIPTLFLNQFTERKTLTFEASAENSIKPLVLLIKLLVPGYYGKVNGLGNTYFGGNYWSYWETGIYIGVLPLCLAVYYAFRKRRGRTAILAILGLFSLWFSLGKYGGLYNVLYYLLPPLQKFRNPPRFSAFFVLTFAPLAGFAVDYLRKADRKEITGFVRLTLAVLLFAIGLNAVLRLGGTPADYKALIHHETRLKAVNIFLLLSFLSFLLVYLYRTTQKGGLLLLIPVLIAADLYLFGHDFPLGRRNPSEYYDVYKLPEFIRKDNSIYRLNIRQGGIIYLPRNVGPVIGYEVIDGYEVLKLDRYVKFYDKADPHLRLDLLNVKYKLRVDMERRQMELVENSTFLPRVFSVKEVRKVTESEAFAHVKSADFDYRTIALVEGYDLERTEFSDSGMVRIVSRGDEYYEIETDFADSAFLVLSHVWYPEWHAWVDGKEVKIYPVDYALTGLVVPPGKHRVSVKYVPSSFHRGLRYTLGTLVIALFVLLVSWKRERKRVRD